MIMGVCAAEGGVLDLFYEYGAGKYMLAVFWLARPPQMKKGA